jgi:hypothetical protein
MRRVLHGAFAVAVSASCGFAQDCHPAALGTAVAPTWVRRMVEYEGYVYAVNGWDGFYVFDTSDPASPALVATIAAPTMQDGSSDIMVVGQTLLVLDSDCTLARYDLTDPGSPEYLGYTCNHSAGRFTLEGTTLYIAAQDNGLMILDVADPAAPVLLAEFDGDFFVSDVEVAGDYAFLANQIGPELIVADVSDPTKASVVGSLAVDGFGPFNTAMYGTILYMGGSTLHAIDVSDPLHPTEVSSTSLPGTWTYDIEIEGDRAIVAVGNSGFVILDLTDPAHPVQIGQRGLSPGGEVRAALIDGDIAYVGSDGHVFEIADLSSCSGCVVDFTGDGLADFFDVQAFLSAFAASDPDADFTGDAVLDVFDILAFLDAFAEGCP